MLAGGYSWRLFFYVEAAFAGALLILAFIFVEETTYHRKPPTIDERVKTTDSRKATFEYQESNTYVPARKSFLKTLKPWSKIDHEAEFLMTMLRPFSYFIVPAVFWVITTYGEYPNHHPGWKYLLTHPTRDLHWVRCFGFQLHIPNQNRRSALQLERSEWFCISILLNLD